MDQVNHDRRQFPARSSTGRGPLVRHEPWRTRRLARCLGRTSALAIAAWTLLSAQPAESAPPGSSLDRSPDREVGTGLAPDASTRHAAYSSPVTVIHVTGTADSPPPGAPPGSMLYSLPVEQAGAPDRAVATVPAPGVPAKRPVRPRVAAKSPSVAPSHATGTAGSATAAPRPGVARRSQPVEPPALAISAGGRRTFDRGEPVNLEIHTNRDAYVYCYLQDEQRRIARIYPNRWTPNGPVAAGQTLSLPGEMRFQIVMNDLGVTEKIACLATATEVSRQLPLEIFGNDLEPLTVATLDQIRQGFLQTTDGQFDQETFHLRPR